MRKLFLFLLFVNLFAPGNAQIIKRLKNRVKQSAENKITNKADEKVNKAVDEVLNPPENKKETNAKNNKPVANSGEEQQQQKDGYITLSLSASKIFTGGSIDISGESMVYEKFRQVEITIKGPSYNETYNVNLDPNDKFNVTWKAEGGKGKYTATAKSSDGKASESADFEVADKIMIENLTQENINVTTEAYKKLKEKTDAVKDYLTPKDKAELDKKMEVVTEKKDAVLKLFTDLNTACKQVAAIAKSGKDLPPNMADNLSSLNNELSKQAKQVQNAMEFANHQPADNTVCEYLVMVSEACAAFSTFTNLWANSVSAIIKNIVLDKGVPKATEVLNTKGRAPVPSDYDIALKEPAKIFATSKFDAEALTTKLGTAGLTGDIVQYAADYLLKQYCGVFKGNFTHDYNVTFRNQSGETWWKYSVEMKASFTLRYPKDKNQGNIIKMKGNLEGNATHFDFFTDLNKEDEYKSTTKGNVPIKELKRITPPAAPFSVSQNDILGFGAIARTAVTPACFNITFDAEYDKDAGSIKLFVNSALVDFSPVVRNRLVFVMFAAGLPLIRWMEFPIHKALLTTRSVIRDNNEFKVTSDAKGDLQFSGKGTKHLGDKSAAIEQILNFTISAKKD